MMLGLESCPDGYWLANRWAYTKDWGVSFGVPCYDARDHRNFRNVDCHFDVRVEGTLSMWSWHLGLRPVVVLEKGAFSNATGGGTEENPIILHK